MVIAKSPKQPDPGHCQKPKTTGHIMLMTESPKQAKLTTIAKSPKQSSYFIMLLMAESPKQAELMVIAKSPKQSSSSYLWPTFQNKQLISWGNGSGFYGRF